MNLNKTPVEFDLRALLAVHKRDIMFSINCHAIGTIQEFTSSGQQTAKVTINYKQSYTSTTPGDPPILKDYPIILDCPVIILGGGNGALTFPIQPGDTCLALFNDNDMDNWFAGNSGDAPATNRLHSFSDALVLIGPRSMQDAIASYDTSRVVLFKGDTALKLGNKVNLKNSTKDLLTVLNGMIDLLSNLETALTTFSGSLVSGGGTPPAVIAAATALGTSLTTLMAALTAFKTTDTGGLLE